MSVPAVPVVAEKLQASDGPIIMSGIGTIVACNVVDIHAQVTGTIDHIGFVEVRPCIRAASLRSSIRVPSGLRCGRQKPTWCAITRT
jgi:hypothetical protein